MTSVGILVALRFGLVSPEIVHVQDVGVSYALAAAAALAYELPTVVRYPYALALAGYVAYGLLSRGGFTNAGHAAALALGAAAYPRLRRRRSLPPRIRAATPAVAAALVAAAAGGSVLAVAASAGL